MDNLDRRSFLKGSALLTVGAMVVPSILAANSAGVSASDKLNVAFIGVGGKGMHAINLLVNHPNINVVALADVNDQSAANGYNLLPNIPHFRDFRKMLDQLNKQIDGVIISTPDHSHHYIAKWCMKMGKHVYLEKPLAHSIHEVRDLMRMEKETGLVCQMGNQGHSGPGIKQLNEWIRKGYLGEVSEVHAWTNVGWNKVNATRPEAQPVPETLDWDLWLNAAAEVAHNKAYYPAVWRGWNEFGSGALGDWACHNMDAPYFALGLDCPGKVEIESTGPSLLSFPESVKLTYTFKSGKYGNQVKFNWYQGPKFTPPRPAQLEEGRKMGNEGGGTLIVGTKSTVMMYSHATSPCFIPQSKHSEMADLVTIKEVPNAPKTYWNGHYDNWINACKGIGKPNADFAYGGRLTETMLLGNIAIKTNRSFSIDPVTRKILNDPKAMALMNRSSPRKGWEV
jgi:predicted dehydrogenase